MYWTEWGESGTILTTAYAPAGLLQGDCSAVHQDRWLSRSDGGGTPTKTAQTVFCVLLPHSISTQTSMRHCTLWLLRHLP